MTPVPCSCSGHVECVKWLVANRSSMSVKDDMGRTPREIAEEFRHEEVVKFLKACEEELDNPSSGFAQLRNPGGYVKENIDSQRLFNF